MTGPNILITGSTGLVGMHVLYELVGEMGRGDLAGTIYPVLRTPPPLTAVQRVDQVLNNGFVPTSVRGCVPSVRKAIRPLAADLCDSANLKQVIRSAIPVDEPLTVLHCAGSVNLETTPEAKDDVHAHNYHGTLNLLRALEGYAVRFIYVGTVFCAGVQQGRIGDDYLSLQSRVYRNPYEESKARIELEIAQYCREKGIEFQLLRPSIICGRAMEEPLYYTPKFDVFYGWLKFFWQLKNAGLHSPLRLCISRQATMNVVPVDFVAKAIVKAVHSHAGQLNIANPTTSNTIWVIQSGLECIGYKGVSFVDSVPQDPNRIEQFYYKTVGALFESYINSDASNYDCNKLLAFMGPVTIPPLAEHIGGFVAFAMQHDFDERKINHAPQAGVAKT